MNKIKQVYNALDSKFPFRTAEEWDNVGILYGQGQKTLTKAVVALDLTKKVFEEAIKERAELIITHHPFIFEDDLEKEFENAPYKKEILERVINTGMVIISVHTNYDKSLKGMKEATEEIIGLKSEKIKDAYGFQFTKKMKSVEIEELLVTKLNGFISQMNFNETVIVDKFSLIPGACSPSDVIKHHEAGSDIIITGDIKWSTWVMANEQGIKLMQISHSIEEVFVDHVSRILRNKLKDTTIISAPITK